MFAPKRGSLGDRMFFARCWALFWWSISLACGFIVILHDVVCILTIILYTAAAFPLSWFGEPCLGLHYEDVAGADMADVFGGTRRPYAHAVDAIQGILFVLTLGLVCIRWHMAAIDTSTLMWGICQWATFYMGVAGSGRALGTSSDDDGE